jgi:hypothetical protein
VSVIRTVRYLRGRQGADSICLPLRVVKPTSLLAFGCESFGGHPMKCRAFEQKETFQLLHFRNTTSKWSVGRVLTRVYVYFAGKESVPLPLGTRENHHQPKGKMVILMALESVLAADAAYD